MKKILILSLLFILGAISAFGWDPFKDTSLVGANFNGKNGLWFTANQNAQLTVSLNRGQSAGVQVGYYTFDGDNMSNKTYLNFVDSTASFDVNAGQSIGYFMEVNGNTYYSVNEFNEGKKKGPFLIANSIGGGHGESHGDRNFTFSDGHGGNRLDLTFNVTAGKVTPTGEPLPGIAMSLIIVGGMFGGFKYFIRRKNGVKSN